MKDIEAGEVEARPADFESGISGDARSWLYSLLIAPSAVVEGGVVQGGVLAYLLSRHGVGSGAQAHIIALVSLPTSLYFLWSPITDFFVRRRTWLLIAAPVEALAMFAAFRQQDLSSQAAICLLFLSMALGRMTVSSCGGMMGAMRSEPVRRRAGSFYQAGAMGFGALSAWVLVWLSSRAGQGVLGLVAAGMIVVPSLFALATPRQQEIATVTLGETVHHIGREFKATFLRWEALPYVACMTFPMGSGAAIGLLSGIARQYRVGGDSVALINGLLGGLLMAAGSTSMAWLPTKTRAPVAYMTVALINAAMLCILWLGPLRPSTYFVGVALYLFTIGTCNAMFTAVVLEFMGDSGKSGSVRYSIINSLGNVPVLYMIVLDGWGGDKWGARGLAGTEAIVGGVGGAILLAYFLTRRRVDAETAPVEAAS